MSDHTENSSIKEIAIIALILGILGILALQNQPLSSILSSSPYNGCSIDSDCALKVATCHTCACEAVNNNWKPFCIVKSAANECKTCDASGSEFELKCVENMCQKVQK